jgi:hypothetical protein
MAVSGVAFFMVDGSLVGLFNNGPILAHQMPQASAVHHITVTPGLRQNRGDSSVSTRCCLQGSRS